MLRNKVAPTTSKWNNMMMKNTFGSMLSQKKIHVFIVPITFVSILIVNTKKYTKIDRIVLNLSKLLKLEKLQKKQA